MPSFSWYNGYSPRERARNLVQLKRLIAEGQLPTANGPCALCSDSQADHYEYHNEDYSLPLNTRPPGLLVLCRDCHRSKLHRRFLAPDAWVAFLAHVRRGGYARDLSSPCIAKEVAAFRSSMDRAAKVSLKQLRPYTRQIGTEWFASLRLDAASLRDATARFCVQQAGASRGAR